MTALKQMNDEIRKQIAEWEKSNNDCYDDSDSDSDSDSNASITKEVDGGGGDHQDYPTRFDSTYVIVSRLNDESYDDTTTMKNGNEFDTTQLEKNNLILLERTNNN